MKHPNKLNNILI